MHRLSDAWFPIVLLVVCVVLIWCGYAEAGIIVIGAAVGDWVGECDGVPVAFEVEAGLTDSTGIFYLPCESSIAVHVVTDECVPRPQGCQWEQD